MTGTVSSVSMMRITITSLELMILRKSAEGQSEKEIASQLTLSKQQVISDKRSILRKLNATNPLQGIQNLAKTGFSVVD